ncbi:MAG: TetR family transcriptional regulator, partial [Propioniciclava sp.]
MTGPHPTTRRPRRSDPDRRARILTSALDVVAEVGVAGVSHRRVATAADIPLGSMTYHFTGMDALLEEAFT